MLVFDARTLAQCKGGLALLLDGPNECGDGVAATAVAVAIVFVAAISFYLAP